jgi:hypothetical protein
MSSLRRSILSSMATVSTFRRPVHTHKTSKQELDDLRAVIRRDLSDAAIPALSEDRRFATAYNAALQAAKMAVACAGYGWEQFPGITRSVLSVLALHLESRRTDW